MASIIPVILTLLSNIIPSLGNATAVGKIIQVLIEILPVVIKEIQDLTPMIKNIIEALKNNPATTADQLSKLEELDAKVDADFEAAVTAAQAEDNQ